MVTLAKRYALISDVHGNLEALRAVIEDIQDRGITDIVCLGDIVGYGPCPAEVSDIIMSECKVSLKGNHDEALIHGAFAFSKRASEAIDYCRQVMEPAMFSGRQRKKRWNYLKDLPETFQSGQSLFVHGSPRDPVSEYILPSDLQWNFGGEKFIEIFNQIDQFLFCGHTHLPGIFTRTQFYNLNELEHKNIEFSKKEKYIINVGSVGQPRDKDPKACYVEVDGDEISFHRIPYDIEKTISQINAIPEIHPVLGERLRKGI